MSIAIISHPDCELHDEGKGHPERPQRVQVIQEALKKTAFNMDVNYYEAPLIQREQLDNVHDPAYVEWLIAKAPHTGTFRIDEDTMMNTHTLRAAYLAAGSVPLAVDLVMSGEASVAFCNVRPPGHHAEYDRAMGFCFFNNVAIGVVHAMKQHGLKKAAIIDFDVHHGNGTQNIFQDNKQVMLCSSFEFPQYPGYDPSMDNEHILNLPLPTGTSGAEFRKKTAAKWFEKLDRFAPQIIFFSAGFDAHENDPLAGLELQAADYVWLTREIAKLANKHCDGKMISVLEGGYDLQALGECVPAHVKAMVA